MKRISPSSIPVWLRLFVFVAAISCSAILAQPPNGPAGTLPQPVPAGNDLSAAILEWTPPALNQLSTQAVAKENFTLDRTMLAAAAGLMPDNDADVKQAIAKLDGISIHVLRFATPAPGDSAIDPAQIEAIRDAYHLRGWKHLLTTTGAQGPVHNGAMHDQTTDVWLVLDGANVRGAVVLVESPKSLTLATMAGNLSPVDLLHLRGHFGIPQFEGHGLTGDQSR